MEQPVSLLPWLLAGITKDSRLPRNNPGLVTCRNLRVTNNGLETLETMPAYAAIDTWPNPKLFHGREVTLKANKATLDTINTRVGPWVESTDVDIQPGFHYDHNAAAYPTPAPGITTQADESWQFVDFWGTYLLLNTVTAIAKTGRFTDPVESSEVTILTGDNFKDGRAVLGGFDPTNYWSNHWKAYLNKLTTLDPDITLPAEVSALLDLDVGPGWNWVWWSSIGGGDLLYHLFPESMFNPITPANGTYAINTDGGVQEYEVIGDNILDDSTFATGTPWTFVGGWVYNGIDYWADHAATGGDDYLRQTAGNMIGTLKQNTWYEIEFRVRDTPTGGVMKAGFTGGTTEAWSPSGHIFAYVYKYALFTGDNTDFECNATGSWGDGALDGLDDIYVREARLLNVKAHDITNLTTPNLLTNAKPIENDSWWDGQNGEHSSANTDAQYWEICLRKDRLQNPHFKSESGGNPLVWNMDAACTYDRDTGTVLFAVGSSGVRAGLNSIRQDDLDLDDAGDAFEAGVWYQVIMRFVKDSWTTGSMRFQFTDIQEEGVTYFDIPKNASYWGDNFMLKTWNPDFDFVELQMKLPVAGTHTNKDVNLWGELCDAKIEHFSIRRFGEDGGGGDITTFPAFQNATPDGPNLHFDSSIKYTEGGPVTHFLNGYDLVPGRKYTVTWTQKFGIDAAASVRPLLGGSEVRDDGSGYLSGEGTFIKHMFCGTGVNDLEFEVSGDNDLYLYDISLTEHVDNDTTANFHIQEERDPMLDFWERNEQGAMPLPNQGTLFCVKTLDQFCICYSTGGITALTHYTKPISIMAPVDIPRMPKHLGLLDRGAVGSGADRHIFIGTNHKLYQINADLTFVEIGYQHIFELSAWATGKIEISYDDKEDEFYISNGTDCYGLHGTSLFQHNQNITSLAFVEGTRTAIATDVASPSDCEILTREFSGPDPRRVYTIDAVELSGSFTVDPAPFTCSIDVKFGPGEAWVRLASGAFDSRGISRAQIEGRLFRIHLIATDRTEVDYIDDLAYVIRDEGKTTRNPLLTS